MRVDCGGPALRLSHAQLPQNARLELIQLPLPRTSLLLGTAHERMVIVGQDLLRPRSLDVTQSGDRLADKHFEHGIRNIYLSLRLFKFVVEPFGLGLRHLAIQQIHKFLFANLREELLVEHTPVDELLSGQRACLRESPSEKLHKQKW